MKIRSFSMALVILLSCSGAVFADDASNVNPAAVQSSLSAPASGLVSRQASIAIKVAGFDEASDRVRQLAASYGATVLDSKTYVNDKGHKHGRLNIRVDSAKFDAFRAALRPMGALFSDSVNADDQTSEYEGLSRRVAVLNVHQSRLTSILNGTRRLRGSDILFIQDRLFRAETDQQDLLQQQDDMRVSAGSSTVLVTLFEPLSMPVTAPAHVSIEKRFRTSFGIAHGQLVQSEDRAATAAAYAVIYSPIWLPLLIVCLLMIAWIWRRRRFIIAATADFMRACRIVLRRETE